VDEDVVTEQDLRRALDARHVIWEQDQRTIARLEAENAELRRQIAASDCTSTPEGYEQTIEICRAALAGIGADPIHTIRLAEMARDLRAQHEQINAAIEDVLTSVVRDPVAHRLEVREAILDFAAALESDQADNPREPETFTRLVHLLGGLERARALGEALLILRYAPQGEEGQGSGPVMAA